MTQSFHKLTAMLCLALAACSSGANKQQIETDAESVDSISIQVPEFNADSAYDHISAQVAMGPRIPESAAHRRCVDYIVSNLKSFGADSVAIQEATATLHNGTTKPLRNIFASFNSSAPRRILLAAHYDTRPWADEETDPQLHHTPIDGANDGASGVGVALELARLIGNQSPEIGVDFLFTDLEDSGISDDDPDSGESSWCLGSQYWAKNNGYTPERRPVYGILLDMVGGEGAYFYREYFSEQQARWVNAKVWKAAKDEGVDRFIDAPYGAVTDDHLFINSARIPCIDIIECNNPTTGSFPPYWHTMRDSMPIIDKSTLSDVGRTLARLIYTETK